MPEVPSGSYEGVIDKGTLDAILCGTSSSRSSMMMLLECCRVLGPMGALMVITYGDPSARLQYLNQEVFGWSVEVGAPAGHRSCLLPGVCIALTGSKWKPCAAVDVYTCHQ